MARFLASLSGRVFWLTAAIVALAVLTAVAVSGWIATRSADAAVEEAVAGASRSLRLAQEQRFEQLRLIARLFVGDPYLAAYVAEAADSGDALSILDLLDERQGDLGFDFAIALNTDGLVLARTDTPGAVGQDLSAEPLVSGALESFEAFGVWQTRAALYDSIAVPVAVGPNLAGFVITGNAIDDQVALQLKQVAAADVVFVADGAPPRVVASTVDEEVAETLLAAVGQGRASEQPLSLIAAGQRWIAQADDLLGADGEVVGRAIALLSVDAQLAPFNRMRLAMTITGLAAVLLAATAIHSLTHRAMQPLGRLSLAAQEATRGEYDVPIAVEREDEVGELANSFRQLLSELREKRDMIDYLAKISRALPDPEGDTTSLPTPGGGFEIADEPTLAIDAAGESESPAGDDDTEVNTAGDTRTFGERFQLLSVLGEGGMGVVYKARDLALDDIVALKTLKREFHNQPEWARLKEELKLARRITHPNVLRTYDFGNVDGMPFISMEYVRGVTLRYLLKQRGRLPYSAGLHLARQLCRGLEAVHGQGVVHRDIKPGNLIVEADGNAKLMDFGIARPSDDEARDRAEEGMIVGTPDYLAPEQVEGREPTVRSDIYACGLVMFEIFTAERPFDGTKPSARMFKRLDHEPRPARELWPEIPASLESIVERCLARDPNGRYESTTELLDDLEALRA